MRIFTPRVWYKSWADRRSLGYRYRKYYWFFRFWHGRPAGYHSFGIGIFGIQLMLSNCPPDKIMAPTLSTKE